MYKESLVGKDRVGLIDDLLTRGVDRVVDKVRLRRRLMSQEPLRIKYGIDPTSPEIHLGRMVPILKVRDLQLLGCKPVLIIGDETGVIGDTSDKNAERPMLTSEVVRRNMGGYLDQIGQVIDLSNAEIHYNSEWLQQLSLREFAEVTDLFSVHEFISREKIKARLDTGKRVSLRETLYPTLQGYDSYRVDADVELGGSDQWFNLLTGRSIQQHFNCQPQDIITTELLIGLDGRKMSSSWGNTISVKDTPDNIFGKLMSMSDELIVPYMINTTRISLKEIKSYERQMRQGKINPRDVKMHLATEVTSIFYNPQIASQAREKFIELFQKHRQPNESDIIIVETESYKIIDFLILSGAAKSKSEARTLISQKGVKTNGESITSYDYVLTKGDIVQKGKRLFYKVG